MEPELSHYFNIIMQWATEVKSLAVRTNAETTEDVTIAKKFGAEGIGLCRTEHMFFDNKRILFMRQMILARSLEERKNALSKLEPFQKNDFKSIFKIMEELPVTIRLLDPPLHEFLPNSNEENDELLNSLNLNKEELKTRIEQLGEVNPMLGHRGCRLGITFPEIYQMQAKAILEAAIEVKKEIGKSPVIEIMIPLIFSSQELKYIKESILEVVGVLKNNHPELPKFLIGTMIELPRAALVADEIATHADFFSFGTNDLTQTTYGISRDDSSRFLDSYLDKNIIEIDPFISIDQNGVGSLIKIARDKSKKVNPKIKLGICGEHGGDPKSIAFCNEIKLDYVSCSPYRIPIARLSAAQAVIKAELSKLK